jgi:hypothetical protein
VWSAGGVIDGVTVSVTAAASPNVIVMSFAGRGPCPSFVQTAVDLAVSQNVTLLAAAGNDPALRAADFFPANCRGVLSVGALNWRGQRASYSSLDADLLMPGGDAERGVPCLSPTAQPDLLSSCMGTSIALPHAAGLVALGGRRLLHGAVEDSVSSAGGHMAATDPTTTTTYPWDGAPVQGAATLQSASNFTLRLPVTAGAATHMCAILQGDRLKCWGLNNVGQLGIGATYYMGDAASELGLNLPWVDVGLGRSVLQVALGASSTCALLDNNLVKCWGAGLYLGQGGTVNKGDNTNSVGTNVPYTVLAQNSVGFCEQLAAGQNHICALLTN